ncbi:DUF4136 domain-containing protein [Sphingomonas sp. CL5.1]|uniref:hypothetical protein n=1 Tax=Sphingomonas sp. CL5.1 TaxID=2653203 RepID=UPI001582897C|nr:hypothetical protein [Sphingomonas sp. CL5.1]QKR98689.1 DUF4136 domain-containing protein [Sphingomonas sp. CL5.1]
MRRKMVAATIGLAATGLAGCATAPTSFPVQVSRFHYDAMASRGTITVEPLPGGSVASIEYKTYAAAVEAELLRAGYTSPPPGQPGEYLATVSFSRAERALPPKRSPFTIGIGGGSFSGGRGGGVGLGGGVSFPVGGQRDRVGIVTELSVRIRHGADAVWEGQAQSLTDTSVPNVDTQAIAERLAHALFTGFPGESGRTIEVK